MTPEEAKEMRHLSMQSQIDAMLSKPGKSQAYAHGFKDECEFVAKYYKMLGWEQITVKQPGGVHDGRADIWIVEVTYQR